MHSRGTRDDLSHECQFHHSPMAGITGEVKLPGSVRVFFTVAVITLLLVLVAIETHPAGEAARLSSRLKSYRTSVACPCACEEQGAAGFGVGAPASSGAAAADGAKCPKALDCAEASACPECAQCPQQQACPDPSPCPQTTTGNGSGTNQPLADALAALQRVPWEPSLPENELQKGVMSYGDPARMRRFVHKLLAGQPVTVGEWEAALVLLRQRRPCPCCRWSRPATAHVASCVVAIGGSVTRGHKASDIGQTSFVALLFKWINATFPHPQHHLLNRAISGAACCWFTPGAASNLTQSLPLCAPTRACCGLQPHSPPSSRCASLG